MKSLKPKFDWDKFKTERIAVYCHEEYGDFLTACDKNDIIWKNGMKCSADTSPKFSPLGTCFLINNKNKTNELSWNYLDEVECDHKIINYCDYDFSNIIEKNSIANIHNNQSLTKNIFCAISRYQEVVNQKGSNDSITSLYLCWDNCLRVTFKDFETESEYELDFLIDSENLLCISNAVNGRELFDDIDEPDNGTGFTKEELNYIRYGNNVKELQNEEIER